MTFYPSTQSWTPAAPSQAQAERLERLIEHLSTTDADFFDVRDNYLEIAPPLVEAVKVAQRQRALSDNPAEVLRHAGRLVRLVHGYGDLARDLADVVAKVRGGVSVDDILATDQDWADEVAFERRNAGLD